MSEEGFIEGEGEHTEIPWELVSSIFEPLESQNSDKGKQIKIILTNSEHYLFTSVKNFRGVFSALNKAKEKYLLSLQQKIVEQNKVIEQEVDKLTGGFWKKNGKKKKNKTRIFL